MEGYGKDKKWKDRQKQGSYRKSKEMERKRKKRSEKEKKESLRSKGRKLKEKESMEEKEAKVEMWFVGSVLVHERMSLLSSFGKVYVPCPWAPDCLDLSHWTRDKFHQQMSWYCCEQGTLDDVTYYTAL